MSRNWIRECSLKVDVAAIPFKEGAGSSGAGGEATGISTLDLSTMRVKFTVFRNTLLTPNESWIRIYNLNKDTTMRLLRAADSNSGHIVTLEAGYKDASGPIYKGELTYAVIGRESPTDTFIDLNCKDGGELLSNGNASKTFDPGSKQKDHMDYLKKIAKDQYGIEEGETKNLLDGKYPKSVTLLGPFKDVWRTIGKSNDNKTYIDNRKMFTVPMDYSKGEIQLDEGHGLIGIPQVTSEGIIITALINPVFKVDAKITIDSSKIRQMELPPGYQGLIKTQSANEMMGVGDGTYTIASIEYRGDTRGQEWYAIMSCYGSKTGGPTPQQLQATI